MLMALYVAVVFGLIYVGLVKELWGFEYEYEYLPSKDLQIEVAGCDVVFLAAAASATVGQVKVFGQWNLLKTRSIDDFQIYTDVSSPEANAKGRNKRRPVAKSIR